MISFNVFLSLCLMISYKERRPSTWVPEGTFAWGEDSQSSWYTNTYLHCNSKFSPSSGLLLTFDLVRLLQIIFVFLFLQILFASALLPLCSFWMDAVEKFLILWSFISSFIYSMPVSLSSLYFRVSTPKWKQMTVTSWIAANCQLPVFWDPLCPRTYQGWVIWRYKYHDKWYHNALLDHADSTVRDTCVWLDVKYICIDS